MANKHRCEVPFPALGEGLFIRFSVGDLAQLESEYGDAFFDAIERGCGSQSPNVITNCLRVGLKRKHEESGKDICAFDGIDLDNPTDEEFTIGLAGKPILDALSQSWLGKSYDQLVDEAEKAREAEEAQKVEHAKEAVTKAVEVGKAAGIPFDQKALLEAVSTMLTDAVSTQELSGN